jgi:hypothetical protein
VASPTVPQRASSTPTAHRWHSASLCSVVERWSCLTVRMRDSIQESGARCPGRRCGGHSTSATGIPAGAGRSHRRYSIQRKDSLPSVTRQRVAGRAIVTFRQTRSPDNRTSTPPQRSAGTSPATSATAASRRVTADTVQCQAAPWAVALRLPDDALGRLFSLRERPTVELALPLTLSSNQRHSRAVRSTFHRKTVAPQPNQRGRTTIAGGCRRLAEPRTPSRDYGERDTTMIFRATSCLPLLANELPFARLPRAGPLPGRCAVEGPL